MHQQTKGDIFMKPDKKENCKTIIKQIMTVIKRNCDNEQFLRKLLTRAVNIENLFNKK